MKIWRFYKHLLKKNQKWIGRISLWAGAWVIMGALAFIYQPELFSDLRQFLDEVFRDILGEQELQLDFPAALLIFQNNIVAAIVVLFLGIIFGLAPLLSVAVNFFILGFLFPVFAVSSPAASQTPGILIFLLSVLPHGIVEIPAFIIASAFGMRLGFFWKRPVKSRSRKHNFILALKQNLQIFPLLVFFFFIAAVLEIFLTGRLVEYFTR